MSRRGRREQVVRENEEPEPQEVIDALDEDESIEVAESKARSRAAVRPIRDQPDDLVFRFEVGPAILSQLLDKLDRLAAVPLSSALDAPYPGFYQLFLGNEPKYIGKTARPIGQRLREHARKLRHRKGIVQSDLRCRYAFVEDPSLVDVAEGALIDFFGTKNLAEWNASGFGSKVTGHRRGQQDASQWSQRYPPDLSVELTLTVSAPTSVDKVLRALATMSPITVAVPGRHRAHFRSDHAEDTDFDLAPKPFIEWMSEIESKLAPGWRVNRQAESWYVEPGT